VPGLRRLLALTLLGIGLSACGNSFDDEIQFPTKAQLGRTCFQEVEDAYSTFSRLRLEDDDWLVLSTLRDRAWKRCVQTYGEYEAVLEQAEEDDLRR
jgi:hypothetical protein